MVTHEDAATIRALSDKLDPVRHESDMCYDMSYAAYDWANLADLLVENSPRTDFPGRVQQEIEFFDKVRSDYGPALYENPDYATIMAIGARIIAEGKTRKLDPDGYLCSLKIIHEEFGSYLSAFGVFLVREHIEEAEYASQHLTITFSLSPAGFGPCALRHKSHPGKTCTLDDLLFRAGKLPSIVPERVPEPTTKEQVQILFASVDKTLRAHADDILADRLGAFASLVVASQERDRLYVSECERLYELEHGHPVVWDDVE